MRTSLLLLSLLNFMPLACRTSSKNGRPDSNLNSSFRPPVLDKSVLEGISFKFCADKRSLSLINNLWLTYFDLLGYNHFKESGPIYESLGFGDKGDGAMFRKYWFVLRLKRINEKLIDTDDTWKDEAERLVIYENVLRQYEKEFGEKYVDDGKKSINYQAEIISGEDVKKKIIFLSSVKLENDSLIQNESQAMYAEHPGLDFSVIVFRGTENDFKPDIIADVKLTQVEMNGLGKVHFGFRHSTDELSDKIIHILEQKSKSKTIRLWITGHSLGAAMATLMTADILMRKEKGELKNVELIGSYNVGSPRVGDNEFAEKFDSLTQKYKVNFVRFRNHRDMITGIPPGSMFASEYWHVGALGYYDAQGDLFYGDGWKDIENQSDINNSTPLSFSDHQSVTYLNLAKRALLANPDKSISRCDLSPDDRPLLPFKENPASR